MNMTASYLLAKCEEVKKPVIGKPYRVIGFNINGAIYSIESFNDGSIKFKGYAMPINKERLKFYEVEN